MGMKKLRLPRLQRSKRKDRSHSAHLNAGDRGCPPLRITSDYKYDFSIVIPQGMYQEIYNFLFDDPSTEHMGVILAGVNRYGTTIKLLGRAFIPALPEDCEVEALGGVRAKQEFSSRIMQICAREGLSQIDVHSHPFGTSKDVRFSGIDDRHEMEMAKYIYSRLPNTYYASIVLNQGYFDARAWVKQKHPDAIGCKYIRSLILSGFPLLEEAPASTPEEKVREAPPPNDFTQRQVLAYGAEGQLRLRRCRVGLIGAGGLGSVLTESMARLGVEDFVLVDPDVAENTNLNRVVGMSYRDVKRSRPKVQIAKRTIKAINPQAKVLAMKSTLFDKRVLSKLKSVDVLFVATDNHASRMIAQILATQYLLPLISVGVEILSNESGQLTDVSGEVVLSLPGTAGCCLQCLNRFNPSMAALELMEGVERQRVVRRGYIEAHDIPAPSVNHLNGVVANLAIVEFHNLISPFKKPVFWVEYNQLKSEAKGRPIWRDAECAICSPSTHLGLGDLEPIDKSFQAVNDSSVIATLPKITLDVSDII